jgi:hypothetical protein
MKSSLLAIYLNDHLAGATIGRELARRTASSNRGTEYGPDLQRLAEEINEDRESLLALMRALKVTPDPLKVAGAWAAEKLGRVKLNGQLLGYSPLSRVVELEALSLGVNGKLSMWMALLEVLPDARPGGVEIEQLAGRARGQLDELAELRRQASVEAFG